MSRNDKVFESLAFSPIFNMIGAIADRLDINGVTVAMAINSFPEGEEDFPLPHVAIVTADDQEGVNKEVQDRVFGKIADIVNEVSARGDCDDEPFDAEVHPGVLFTIASDYRAYAYVILLIELPDDMSELGLDETELIMELADFINNELPRFGEYGELMPDEDQLSFECDPVVESVYGRLYEAGAIHAYDIDYEEEEEEEE